jgi:hypothetical protein
MGYHKECRYCEDEIYLEEDEQDGRWKAYDDEYCESEHDCRSHEFEIECKYCGNDIMLRQLSDGKWKPTELSGLHHFCNREPPEPKK